MAKARARKAAKKAGKRSVGARALGASRASKSSKQKAAKRASSAARPGMKKRADLGADVGMYFEKLGAEHRAIADVLHGVVREAAPEASHAIKWGMPVYEHKGMLCYIRSRPRYVTFGFYRQGKHLEDPRRMLEGTGEAMRHIKIALGSAVDEAYLKDLVRQAARFNEEEDGTDPETGSGE